VKTVVISSTNITVADQKKGDGVADEKSFTIINNDMNPFFKSKIEAEKEAFKYMKRLTKKRTFKMCTVHQGILTGPVLIEGVRNLVLEFFTKLMDNTFEGALPQLYYSHIDIED